MARPKKICLITPGHIASNPRLIKEAIALEKHGYNISIIFTQSLAYLQTEDYAVLKAHPSWSFSVLDWTGRGFKSKIARFSTGALQKICTVFSGLSSTYVFDFYILNRFFNWQLKQAIAVKADLYIAHNLGALPVACLAAKRTGSHSGFDAEDFHRYEITDDIQSKVFKTRVAIEDRFIRTIDHFTVASPLIGQAYQRLYSNIQIRGIVLNVFPKIKKQLIVPRSTECLKIFWFSQTVGKGRGIEDIINAIGHCKDERFELHVLGYCSDEMRDYFLQLCRTNGSKDNFLNFHPPVPEKTLFEIASQFDVGVAAETGVPHNREICLTNKIFTYIQCGLAVVASNTAAQSELLGKYDGIGRLYTKGSVAELASIIQSYFHYPDLLNHHKCNSFALGQNELNWEVEQLKFIQAVQTTLA